MHTMHKCVIVKCVIVLIACASAVAEECVAGKSTIDGFSGVDLTGGVAGGLYLLRGYKTIHTGWLEGDQSKPCYFYSSGLPTEVSLFHNDSPFVDGFVSGWSCYGGRSIILDVPVDAPIGEFTWKFTISSFNEINVTTCQQVHILDVPSVLRNPVDKTNLVVPKLEQWENNMLNKGMAHCLNGECCFEGFAWYYDGVRVYHQIHDYTQNDSFLACIEHQKESYFNYVLDNKGGIPGWRVFPHGFYLEYMRTLNPIYRDGVGFLSNNSALAAGGGDGHPDVNRETAYILHAYNMQVKLGEEPSPKRERAVGFAIGHIDLWFMSKKDYLIQSFMVGLTCDALIEYWEETMDERVPWIVKEALDGLWEGFYNETAKTLNYNSDYLEAVFDLNLLIAHEYIWLWAYTGDNVYRDRGDILFESGVTGAWLGWYLLSIQVSEFTDRNIVDGGKQFSQNYRSSFKFVKWRQDPDLAVAPGISGSPSSRSPSSAPLAKSTSSPSSCKDCWCLGVLLAALAVVMQI